MGARSACEATDADRFVLREGGWHPGDIVAFVLTGAWLEIEDGPSQEGTDDRLLERGNDTGMDSSVHEPVLHGVETVGEDIIVPCNAHVGHDRRWCLVCVSSRRGKEVG